MYFDAALFENSTPELDKSVLIESSSGIDNINQEFLRGLTRP